MIKKFTPVSGLVKNLNLPSIDFRPDFNVIFGANGSGKSTILKCIAHYTLIDGFELGGAKPSNQILRDFSVNNQNKSFSDYLNENSETGVANVDMDYAPAFFMSSDMLKDKGKLWDLAMAGSGIFSMGDILIDRKSKDSSGVRMSKMLIRIANLELPDWSKLDGDSIFMQYAKAHNYNKNNKPTLMLDEPDLNMDAINAHYFHKEILPQLSQKFQLIIVSHNPFSLLNPNHIIRLGESYDNLKNLLRELL